MQKETLTHTIQHILHDKKAQVVASFNNCIHIEFILLKTKLNNYSLIWLPVTLDTCMLFHLKMNPEKFINEFQQLPLQNRLTYILENFMDGNWYDFPLEKSNYLQKRINYGLHH